MVIYEVNLTIDKQIYAEYHDWLIEHIRKILGFPGFIQAEIAKEQTFENESPRLAVRYQIDNVDHLKIYLNQHAPTMRAEAVHRFGDKFSASRRIFVEQQFIS